MALSSGIEYIRNRMKISGCIFNCSNNHINPHVFDTWRSNRRDLFYVDGF